MRKHLFSALVLSLLLATDSESQEKKVPIEPGFRTRQLWEYKALGKNQITEMGKADFGAGLNQLGGEGWELITLDKPDKGEGTYIFKRAKARALPVRPERAPPKEDKRRKPFTITFELKHAKARETMQVIEAAFAKKDELRLAVDDRTNMLIVTGTEEMIGEIRALVMTLDVAGGKAK